MVRHYAISQKVTSLSPDEVIGFLQFTWSFQPHYGPEVGSASIRNEYVNLPVGKGGLVHRADNLSTICEPIV
jgi:hypothetical protein